MEYLKPISASDLLHITIIRKGEIKFGEKMLTIPSINDYASYINNCEARFVLFGIPEDIGIKANFGRKGSASAWEIALKSIANIQHNKFCKGNQILILGSIDVSNEMKLAQNLNENNEADREIIYNLVSKIDKEVAHIVSVIIKSGKIPIIIGGGHNNAYGNIKGAALAFGKPINAINFDAHSDFRNLEGRHSGNGFSYAFDEGFLNKYFIFGLHENYNSRNIIKKLIENQDRIQFNTYEELNIRLEKSFKNELNVARKFIENEPFGIEIDLDSLPNIASSAMTNSGFSIEQLRRFIHFFGKNKNATYLHICEGAPTLGEDKNQHLIGKLIGYLITDFIKANNFFE
jgi:formiminoglutamase